MRLTLVLVFGFLTLPHDTEDAKKAIAAILKSNGQIDYDEKAPGRPVIAVNL